jgi:hypothetical protein
MATLPQLEKAFVNADKAGDVEAARRLAKVINEERQRQTDPTIAAAEDSFGPSEVAGTSVPGQGPSFLDKAKGVGETALTLGTGMTGGTLGMIEGTVEGIVKEITTGEFGSYDAANRIEQLAMERAQALTYEPRTETGQQFVQETGEALAPLAAIAPLAEAQAVAGMASRTPVRALAQEKVIQPTTQQMQRTQALAKQISQRVSARLPGLKREPTAGTGKSAGAQAVDKGIIRQAQAEDLPVPIKLTKGQKSRTFEQQRFERETAKLPEQGEKLRERFQQQNEQLQQNLDAFIDMTGAELTDLRGVGEIVDKALRSRAAKDKVKIRTLYKEAEKAGEMEAPVTLTQLSRHLAESGPEAEVANVLKAVKAKAEQLGAVTEGPDGQLVPQPISLKDAELLRRSINNATNAEPTNIRQSAIMKSLIDDETAGAGGDAYRAARAARAKYANDYENISLVKQILNTKRGTDDRAVAMEDVLRKSILQPSASLDSAKQLRRLLQTEGDSGKQAWKELQGGTLRHIRDEALKSVQIDQAGNRIVSPAQLDRVINQLDKTGKLDFIFGKKGAEQLRTINEVAQDVLTAPPGAVNTSNTASVLAGLMDVAISGTAGVPAPIMSSFRLLTNSIKDTKLKARVKQSLGE